MSNVKTRPGVIGRKRKEFGWTWDVMAEKTRVDAKTLRRIDKGEKPVQIRNVHRVAAALGIPADRLIANDEGVSSEGHPQTEVSALSAAELVALAQDCGGDDVRTETTDPDRETINRMRGLHKAVVRHVANHDSPAELNDDRNDPFAALETQIDVKEALADLRHRNIVVLAGVYLHWERLWGPYGDDTGYREPVRVLVLMFTDAGRDPDSMRRTVSYDPGDLPEPDEPDDLDDEIPF
jgi:transcriptional regulator with XRE-family HTH domain